MYLVIPKNVSNSSSGSNLVEAACINNPSEYTCLNLLALTLFLALPESIPSKPNSVINPEGSTACSLM